MVYLKGEDINIGVAGEATRGTYVSPTHFVPGRTPGGIRVMVDKTPIRETSGGGIGSTGSIVTQKRAEGDFEFNVRNNSIGYFLKSLFGQETPSTLVASTVYSHLFEILQGNPQFPTISLALSQLGFQDYKYAKSLVKALEFTFPVDDLPNVKASFLAPNEEAVSDVTVSFDSADHYFRPFDVVVKVAADVASLSGATALALKEISLNIDNNGRLNQNISELNPGDVFGLLHEITGSLKIDYTNETLHDAYVAGTYNAMSIKLTRSDINLGSGNNPSLEFVMPKVSYEKYDPDRPIDDIVMNGIDFTAHFDQTLAYGIKATLVNSKATY